MKGLVISGNKGRYTAGSPDNPWKNSTGAEAWYEVMGWDYWGASVPKLDFISDYQVVVANTEERLVADLTEVAEKRPRGQIWISLIEGLAETYTPDPLRCKRLFDASDAVITINRRTVDYFQALTKAPVVNLGVPYPLEWVSSFATPAADRLDQVLVAPWQHPGPSIVIASELDLTPVVYTKKTARTLRNHLKYRLTGDRLRNAQRDEKKAQLDLSGRTEFRFERELPEFFAEAGRMKFWINLDPRHTWARYVLDAAALSVPIIATASTDHAMELFPETTVESIFDIRAAREIAVRLSNDHEFADRVGTEANARIRSYKGLKQREGMDALLNELAAKKRD